MRILLRNITLSAAGMFLLGCGGDGTEADQLGVAATCEISDDCRDACLTEFKGGYCGIADCRDDADCPEASACVQHDDGINYCFRTCLDKSECNLNRDVESEANCSSNVEFVEEQLEATKACVPPSG